jgi:NAD(P)H-dependent FMN reductase
MSDSLRLITIYGSVRPGRLCDRVAAWVAERVARWPEFDVDAVDPRAIGPVENGDEVDRAVALEERFAAADAFLVITPEYNHGYPAPLKRLIDMVGVPWQAKPVGFVSYGGISGGLRAVEQLRQVFAELHAVTIRDTVSFPGAHRQFGPGGGLLDPAWSERAMDVLLARLRWWALALRDARALRPYTLAA